MTACARNAACSASSATTSAAALTALGLHSLQHRGQEAAGIVTYENGHFHSERRLGLVGDNFNKADVIGRLTGSSALGHVRYSTTGDTILRNVQPLFADLDTGGFAVAHNGNLTNALTLRKALISSGAICQSTSDTEVILHLIARSQRRRIIERFIEAVRQIQGAYSLVCLTNDMLIGARDPIGIRPLVLGRLGSAYVLASETCALDIVGAEFVREIENGEIVTITADGVESHRPFPMRPARPCIFEYIYFSRPDSIVGGRNVYDIRKQMGMQLAKEAPANADVVIPVPDFRRAGGDRLRPAEPRAVRARHHPQSLRRPHLHRAGAAHPPARRQAQALGQRQRRARQPHRADRRQRGARHHLQEDRADDVRGRRPRGAHAHLQPAHHASGFLRHRHAAQGRAARLQHERWRRCASSWAHPASPSCRSTASIARSATRSAMRARRSSPTTASRATTRPTWSTSTGRANTDQLSFLSEVR